MQAHVNSVFEILKIILTKKHHKHAIFAFFYVFLYAYACFLPNI